MELRQTKEDRKYSPYRVLYGKNGGYPDFNDVFVPLETLMVTEQQKDACEVIKQEVFIALTERDDEEERLKKLAFSSLADNRKLRAESEALELKCLRLGAQVARWQDLHQSCIELASELTVEVQQLKARIAAYEARDAEEEEGA